MDWGCPELLPFEEERPGPGAGRDRAGQPCWMAGVALTRRARAAFIFLSAFNCPGR